MAVNYVPVSGCTEVCETPAYYTAEDGSYQITGLTPGTYTVCFSDGYPDPPVAGGTSTTGYSRQCYDKIDDDGQPTIITVAAGRATSGIDGELAAAGAVSGTVTDAGGHPLAGVDVQISTNSGDDSFVTTDANGDYEAQALTAGTSSVCFEAENASGGTSTTGWVDHCTDGVDVVNGKLTAHVDAPLATDSTGDPINGVPVFVVDHAGNFLGAGGLTIDGTFTADGLPAGAYAVCFEGDAAGSGSSTTRYKNVCYRNAPWDLGAPSSQATPVTFTAGTTVEGIDVTLPAG